MPNHDTSVRALIDAYRACERPSEATEARIRRALASAQRAAPPASRRSAAAPWIALAAALILLLALRAGSSREVQRGGGSQSSFTAASARSAQAKARAEPRTTVPTVAPPDSNVTAAAPHTITADGPPAASSEPPPAPRKAAGKRRKAAPGAVAADPVLEEMALLQRAQEALRAQRPGEALAVLDQHAAAYPNGGLAEERQALRITALCAAGGSSQGLALRAEFARVYPRSAYAGRVAAACTESHSETSTPVNGTPAQR